MRSQFLTVLCILTFISCAVGISDATVSLTQTDAVSETSYVKPKPSPKQDKEDKSQKKYFEDRSSGDAPMPSDTVEVRRLAIAQLAYAVLTLVGAIFMFRLRRVGFWIYVAGVVVGIILPVVLAGFGALNSSFGVFISVIFAGLYWVSLKEMR
ncbi:hypothetical protein [Spirosoma flavum]|uniref:DUF4386 family protein n=1 Tax=Spirosoma flavum TaxID=2048557 RepID=A0ABW6AJN5_9BACT